MDCIEEAPRHTPVAGRSDVIVCGGGPAGVSAAICAARAGASVRLIDVNGCLGGVWTAGQLAWLFEMDQPGFAHELGTLLAARGAAFRQDEPPGPQDHYPGFAYDVEAMKLLLEELCRRHEVAVLLRSRVVDVVRADRCLRGVVVEHCGGREVFLAPVVIDASGNGDVAARAGCAWDMGRPENGETQPLTMMALMTADNIEALRPWVSFWRGSLHGPDRKAAVERCRASLAEVGITPSYGSPTIFHAGERVLALMINHEYGVSSLDAQQMSEATMRARAELHRAVAALRARGGPFAGLHIVASAEHIGIREGRRIAGRYRLTLDDLLTGRRFDDAVARTDFNIDVHHTNRASGDAIETHPAIQAYDIPLRCCLAAEVDGLLLAGRCISGDFYAHASYRVTGVASRLGQAAGTCAAFAARERIAPHEVPAGELRSLLPPLD